MVSGTSHLPARAALFAPSPRPTARTAPIAARLLAAAACLMAAAIIIVGWPGLASAHRVNVFAWVEGGAIRCETSFSGGNPARNTKVVVTAAGSGAELTSGVTDAEGRCTLPITPEMRAGKPDLVIEVLAGEGHRNTWPMPAAEYLSAPASGQGAGSEAPQAAGNAATTSAQAEPSAQATPATAVAGGTPRAASGVASGAVIGMDEATLRRIVAETVAEQLAPVRHSLAAMQSGGPRMADVAAGIGYIVGLAGLVLWARARRR